MKLFVNMIVEWLDESESQIERLLWIDQSGTDVAIIEIFNPQALPVFNKCKDIEAAIASGQAKVLEVDPYAKLLRYGESIQDLHSQRRDMAWEVIAPLIEDQTGRIFYSQGRGTILNEREKQTGWTKKTIYKFLRRYWQGGQTKNALLPLFDKCGAKGKERESSSKKRGRKSKIPQVTDLPTGINVNTEIRDKFHRGIRLFYENTEGRTLQGAYQKTLEKFFHKGYHLLPDGTLAPMLPPLSELPTFGQFRYWYEKEKNLAQALEARFGKRRYNLRHREVLGDSTAMAFGPGSLYQIDATIGDIYLVSSLDRNRIIGRPVIYFVIDVFSRMITGLSVSLEGPSWLGAMLALENAFLDKVSFCQEYGVPIDADDWPSQYLPEAILADRGELESKNADNLVDALNIRISNTPPYRADWKGIIERNFRTCNDKMIHFLPGAVHRPRERGDKDYRLDAVLDLHQFRKLIILCVLDHNQNHRMDWYRLDEFMIQDHVDLYPIELWNWGNLHRAGHLRKMAPEIVRLNLLPSAEASVTPKGIYYQGLYYSCPRALQEQWFVKARLKGRWRIAIAYDPRRLDTIYLRPEGGSGVEPCHLTDKEKTFLGRDWYEVVDYFELGKQNTEAARTRQTQNRADFNAQIAEIVKLAAAQTDQALIATQSKHSRLKGIRASRQLERSSERDSLAWQLGTNQNNHYSTPPDNSPPEYVPAPTETEIINEVLGEIWRYDQ